MIIKCDRCKRDYNELSMIKCTHATVNKRYGTKICYWCCKQCKYSIKHKNGLQCGYKEKEAHNG